MANIFFERVNFFFKGAVILLVVGLLIFVFVKSVNYVIQFFGAEAFQNAALQNHEERMRELEGFKAGVEKLIIQSQGR